MDAMVNYLKNVILRMSYNGDNRSLQNSTIHYLNDFNYLCGMRLTLKKIKMVPNRDRISRKVFTFIRAEDYTTTDATYDSELKDPIGRDPIFYYQYKNSFNKKGGYVQYFSGNITYNNANEIFENLTKNEWFTPINTIALTTELMFFNANYKSGLYIAINFLIRNAGTAMVTETVHGFQPQSYDYFNGKDELNVKYALQIIHQILLFIDAINLLIRIAFWAFYFFSGQKVDFPINDFYAIIVLTFSLVSISYWYEYILKEKDSFKLPMNSQDFDNWVSFSNNFEVYFGINSLCIILMCIRNLIELHIEFPTFGTLFSTIGSAKYDLFSYIIIVTTLLTGFAFCSHFLFGYYTPSLSTLGESMVSTIVRIFGRPNYEEMKNSNSEIAPLIFAIFLIIFFFLVLNSFTAVLISHYGKMRKKNLLRIEVNARIAEEDGQRFTQKMINFFLCRNTRNLQNQNAQSDNQKDVLQIENNRKNAINKQEITLWDTIKYNVGTICNSPPKTREQIRSRYNNMLNLLMKEREDLKKVFL